MNINNTILEIVKSSYLSKDDKIRKYGLNADKEKEILRIFPSRRESYRHRRWNVYNSPIWGFNNAPYDSARIIGLIRLVDSYATKMTEDDKYRKPNMLFQEWTQLPHLIKFLEALVIELETDQRTNLLRLCNGVSYLDACIDMLGSIPPNFDQYVTKKGKNLNKPYEFDEDYGKLVSDHLKDKEERAKFIKGANKFVKAHKKNKFFARKEDGTFWINPSIQLQWKLFWSNQGVASDSQMEEWIFSDAEMEYNYFEDVHGKPREVVLSRMGHDPNKLSMDYKTGIRRNAYWFKNIQTGAYLTSYDSDEQMEIITDIIKGVIKKAAKNEGKEIKYYYHDVARALALINRINNQFLANPYSSSLPKYAFRLYNQANGILVRDGMNENLNLVMPIEKYKEAAKIIIGEEGAVMTGLQYENAKDQLAYEEILDKAAEAFKAANKENKFMQYDDSLNRWVLPFFDLPLYPRKWM